MNKKLRLGPLPKTEVVRLTISLPAIVKADLDHYAQLYCATYSEVIDAATLVPHMLAAFMDRDRAFRASRQSSPRNAGASGSASISAAISSTSETAGDGSSR